ncbi:MAG: hypothetical protein ACRCZF_05405, partial [Gemmataceae bacterium]
MTNLKYVGLEEVSSLADPLSRRHRPDRAWRWQLREGTKAGFQLQPQFDRTAGENDAVLRSREHIDYLNRIAAEGVVPSALATKAKAVWWVAKALTDSALPIPAAAAISGGPVEYHWSAGPHQLVSEIPADGPCHWTYRNSRTGELWG